MRPSSSAHSPLSQVAPAGGRRYRPLRTPAFIDDLKGLAGAEQLAEIHIRKDDLEQRIKAWNVLAKRAEVRMLAWERATAFRGHAEELPVIADVGSELDAINAQRSLLAEADQIGPFVAALAAALREVLVARHTDLTNAIETACATLAGDATWSRLDATAQSEICRRLGLDVPPPLTVATDDDLLRTLDARSLAAWRSEIDAVDARAGQALQVAAESLVTSEPPVDVDPTDVPTPPPPITTTVRVRRGTLPDEPAVRTWLLEQETKLMEAVHSGPVIVR